MFTVKRSLKVQIKKKIDNDFSTFITRVFAREVLTRIIHAILSG
jgi:hypothetical protein